ncbi:hypothetical protein UFOVP222_47 [uncultured Caudovirales phage]|uniref:Uncharacterized protein n=1 Tax=uncultured Caudovirales phage TaxID=2100421 RepID=A0A6J5TD50_9CAUD|nr:hypothetical protein UFOVP108_42 [uncultured Caudovirales phage]CAB5219264.1 hypothetical protein UFOVP222_47 [uncultured Caudovirales phage]
MITTTGKDIVAKYLIGQTTAYASYLALGCGAKPRIEDTAEDPFISGDINGFLAKKSLDFEMFRVPIISKGYISEGGVSKVIFTAELPTTDRYAITEIGVYPALNNPVANQDSFNIFSFTTDEGWKYNDTTADTDIPSITGGIDLSTSVLDAATNTDIGPIFQTNVDNATLNAEARSYRNEQLRMSANAIYVRGNFSTISFSGNVPTLGGKYMTLTGANTNLAKANPTDELRLAMSVISKSEADTQIPDSVNVVIQFVTSVNGEYASVKNTISSPAISGGGFGVGNRYAVSSVALGDSNFYKTNNFSWDLVTSVRVYVNALKSGYATSDYWIGLDGLRLENLSDVSPVYGLAAYSTLRHSSYSTGSAVEYATPIVKPLNTSGLVEFKFALDVG